MVGERKKSLICKEMKFQNMSPLLPFYMVRKCSVRITLILSLYSINKLCVGPATPGHVLSTTSQRPTCCLMSNTLILARNVIAWCQVVVVFLSHARDNFATWISTIPVDDALNSESFCLCLIPLIT